MNAAGDAFLMHILVHVINGILIAGTLNNVQGTFTFSIYSLNVHCPT